MRAAGRNDDIQYLQVCDLVHLLSQGDVLQVALVGSLAKALGGKSAVAQVRLGLRSVVAAAHVEDLAAPLDQVVDVLDQIEKPPWLVPHVVLVELQPPVLGFIILQRPSSSPHHINTHTKYI